MDKQIKRNSSFELLRIISILAIIAYHFYLQTAACGASSFVSKVTTMFLGSFGRGAVNVFVMIGAWFLIDMRFSAVRMIRLYLSCLLYAVFFTLLVLLLKLPPSPPSGENAIKALLRVLTPFSSSPLWFVTDYLFLLFLSPFLNRLIHELPQRSFLVLYRVLLIVFVLIPTFESALPAFVVYKYYIVKSDMSWLIVLYLLIGYWKQYGSPSYAIGHRAWWTLLWTVVFSASFCVFDCLLQMRTPSFAVKKFHEFSEFLFMDLSSLFCFVLAVSAFFGFQQLVFVSPKVNRIAKHTLGVYVIHQVPVFIPVMWAIFHVETWIESSWFFVCELGVVMVVFCGCALMDCIGSSLITCLLRMPWLERLSYRIDVVMNDETKD